MVSWRWLQPGLRLKRWVFAICLGTFFLIIGAMSVGLGLFWPPLMPDDQRLHFDPYVVGGLLLGTGVILVFTGIYRLIRRIEKLLKRADESRGLAEIAIQQKKIDAGSKVVCLGGGTGLSTLLAGLREHTHAITAIVSVADDGGSSGRLRHDFDMLPPGDIRNCLIALADSGPGMAQLLQYRFDEGEFAGHSFGNLFLTVLARIRGDFGEAIREANHILSVRGEVLPATLDKVSLVATHTDGSKSTGQALIAKSGKPVKELSLKPAPGAPPRDVIYAIQQAELIILGPGSLYTSVLPPLLDTRIITAINESPAQVVFVINTMGQPGETSSFSASEHIRTLQQHAVGLRIDSVVINSYIPSAGHIEELRKKEIHLTPYDRKVVAELGVRVWLRDVMDLDNPGRHDSAKLARAIMEAFQDSR